MGSISPLVRVPRFELGTPWLKVTCSAIWATPAYTNGGGLGIRTPGPFRDNGFQDRRFKPDSAKPPFAYRSVDETLITYIHDLKSSYSTIDCLFCGIRLITSLYIYILSITSPSICSWDSWRKRRGSNSRAALLRPTGLANPPLHLLGYSSISSSQIRRTAYILYIQH